MLAAVRASLPKSAYKLVARYIPEAQAPGSRTPSQRTQAAPVGQTHHAHSGRRPRYPISITNVVPQPEPGYPNIASLLYFTFILHRVSVFSLSDTHALSVSLSTQPQEVSTGLVPRAQRHNGRNHISDQGMHKMPEMSPLRSPAPDTPHANKPSTRQTLIIPATISLAIFIVVTFVVFPIWRRYRNRYSQYLPLDTISDQTASLRHRITNRLTTLTLPSTWRRDRGRVSAGGGLSDNDDMEDGEELNDVDAATLHALERRVGESRLPDNARRLSRE